MSGVPAGGKPDLFASAMEQVLENDMILRHILERLDSSVYLKIYRLTCGKWKSLATKILKDRFCSERRYFTFYVEDAFQAYLEYFSKAKENMMLNCFRLQPVEDSDHAYALWMDKFFHEFKNLVKSLDVNMVFDSPVQLESILRSQANSLTELKIITSGGPIFGFDMDFSAAPVDFYLTSLKHLCTDSDFLTPPEHIQHRLNILESILIRIPAASKPTFKLDIRESDMIRHTIHLLQKHDLVKSLKLQNIDCACKGDLKLMMDSGVELDYLLTAEKIMYHDAGEDKEVEEALWLQDMYNYLNYQRKTLKLLAWTSKTFKFPPWGMPGMKKLKLTYKNPMRNQELEDHGAQAAVADQNQNLIILYADLFPNLQDLRLVSVAERPETSQTDLDFESMFLGPKLPFTSLQKLQVFFDGITAHVMTLVSKTFPRIKCLDIGHYNGLKDEAQLDFYSALWNAEFKTTIEELVIRFEKRGKKYWRQFELASLFLGVAQNEIEMKKEDLSSVQGNSSIFNYTHLRKVELFAPKRNNAEYGDFCFGETEAISIFGRIEKLEYLFISKKICRFSPAELKSLPQWGNSSNAKSFSSNVDHPIERLFETEFDHYSIHTCTKNLLQK